MDKRLKWGMIAVIACALVAWGVYSQMPKTNSELAKADKIMQGSKGKNKELNVNGTIIKTGPLTDEFTVTGTLIPDENVDLSFETSGQVVSIMFKEGVHVKKGQLLAKVNDKKLQAELKRLVSQLKLAKDRVYRQRTLLQHDAVSQEAYEQVNTELATLQADIDIVKAQIELTELRAPFDGIIGLRQISVGAYATPQTVVSKLTRIVPLKLEFAVPERYARDIKPGTRLQFTIDGVLNSFPAKVYAKESAIDMNTHTLTVRALYANPRRQTYARTVCQHQPEETGDKGRNSHSFGGCRAGNGKRQGVPLQIGKGAARRNKGGTENRRQGAGYQRT